MIAYFGCLLVSIQRFDKQLVYHLGVRLTLGLPHHLTHQKLDCIGLAAHVITHGLRIGNYNVSDDRFNRGSIANLTQTFLVNDVKRGPTSFERDLKNVPRSI